MSEFADIDLLRVNREDSMPVKVCETRYNECFRQRLYGRLHFVKRLRPEYAADPLCREALHKEFLVGYGLEHPAIVKYLRYDNGTIYQEYIDGETLRDLIDGHDPRLASPAFVREVSRQLFEALAYLHSNGILHLDIKPENIMLTRVGQTVKIIDLGACLTAMYDTTPGFTPAYRAPEAVTGKPSVAATDIFQAGLVIRELLQAGGRMPRRWRRFISRATASDPALRFTDAAEALRALPPLPRRLTTATLAAATAAIAAVAALWYLWAVPAQDVSPALTSVGHDQPADTVTAGETQQPAIPPSGEITSFPATSPPAVAPSSTSPSSPMAGIERQLRHDIEDRYRTRVYPLLEPEKHTDGIDLVPFSAASRSAMDYAFARADAMRSRYPQYADEILAATNAIVNGCQQHCAAMAQRLQSHGRTGSASAAASPDTI